MGKFRTLLDQKDYLNGTLGDMVRTLDISGKSKYVEMIVKLLESKNNDNLLSNNNELLFEITSLLSIPQDHIIKLKNENPIYLFFMLHGIVELLGWRESRNLMKFMEYCENNKIRTDISKITTIEDVMFHVSIANLEKEDKEIMEYVIKDYEDDEWLIVRPLSHLSSRKYGAGTKWCTASDHDSSTFYDYTQSGTLIYTMNKTKNFKVAAYKRVYDGVTFWNQVDNRIDSIDSDLPYEILTKIKEIINKGEVNFDLLTEDQKEKLSGRHLELKKSYTDYDLTNEVMDIAGRQEPLRGYLTIQDPGSLDPGSLIAAGSISYPTDQEAPVEERSI